MIHDPEGPGLSGNTAGQNVKRCRQMVRHAVKLGIASRNPFESVDIDLDSDQAKNYDIPHDDSLAILEACPDQEWRTLYSLVRWGGLRCPSEVLNLRWADISWDRGRFKVTSPKLARYKNKKERIVPLFNEVRQELEALREVQQARKPDKSAQYVIQRYRDSETNLRTTFQKICDRAAVPRFPKPFMNCRQTRRNEMEKAGWRDAVLNAWFGHGKGTAAKYYSRATEEEYLAASGQNLGADLGQHGSPPKPTEKLAPRNAPKKTGQRAHTRRCGA
ncbi:MAG TPA: hypothetical protein DDW52_04875 [Planctomycetaceae bacterium]|nr:hypothetical protein [Planctomycetaceae bacterium]